MANIDAVLQALKRCHRKLQDLRTRQELTRNAGRAFTELSSEVDRVIEERRSGVDRRTVRRPTAERRRNGIVK